MDGVKITPHNQWEGRCRSRTLHCLKLWILQHAKPGERWKRRGDFTSEGQGWFQASLNRLQSWNSVWSGWQGRGWLLKVKGCFLGRKLAPGCSSDSQEAKHNSLQQLPLSAWEWNGSPRVSWDEPRGTIPSLPWAFWGCRVEEGQLRRNPLSFPSDSVSKL